MKHFALPAPPNPEGMIRLYEKDYHYLVRVRRLKSGMCFDAALPGGGETQIRILSTVDGILIGECLGDSWKQAPSGQEPASLPPIALFQGLPKGQKMDTIVRQAAEGALSLVLPFQSEYSTARLGKNPSQAFSGEKLRRWQRIVREARQQSGSATDTEVRAPCSLEALLAYWDSIKAKYQRPAGILLHQEPLGKGSFHDYLSNCPDFVVLTVGPEGGFSPREVSLFLDAGFKPFVMGNTILRTETAAVYGAAAIKIILLENQACRKNPAE
ncbi:MAG: RsmE family RNA methyltransferase [Treponema sp.]|nr:RsmE family RNA methyltransferase [Treponema sp.]